MHAKTLRREEELCLEERRKRTLLLFAASRLRVRPERLGHLVIAIVPQDRVEYPWLLTTRVASVLVRKWPPGSDV
jgi:hypothetical protein